MERRKRGKNSWEKKPGEKVEILNKIKRTDEEGREVESYGETWAVTYLTNSQKNNI